MLCKALKSTQAATSDRAARNEVPANEDLLKVMLYPNAA